ncbi:MAG: hypothetical protein ACI3U8_07505 [Candidatus Onthomonas sp.]
MKAEGMLIYELMTGMIDCASAVPPEGLDVADEFAEERPSRILSEAIYEEKARLEEQLTVEQMNALEHIADLQEKLTQTLSLKMYEYGKRMGGKQ